MNQLYRSWQISTAQDMGIEAARNGDTRNPFRDLGLQSQWESSRRCELARMALQRGELAKFEPVLDASDPQPDWQLLREIRHAVRWITGRVSA